MVDVRQWLTVGLGVLFGLFLIAAPRASLKLSVLSGAGQRPHRGEYGNDADISGWLVWATRGVGAICIGVAAFIAL